MRVMAGSDGQGVVVVVVVCPSMRFGLRATGYVVSRPSQTLPLLGLRPCVWRKSTTAKLRMRPAVTFGPLSVIPVLNHTTEAEACGCRLDGVSPRWEYH